MMATAEEVAVWWDGNVPERLVWRGKRWRASDTPTRLTTTPDFLPTAMTHAPERTAGWRLQVTSDDGEAVVIDLLQEQPRWVVARTWA